MAMTFEEIHLSEKQIAKEILLKMIENKHIGLYAPDSDEKNLANVKIVNQLFEEILATVSK